jgi:hypothetical protein
MWTHFLNFTRACERALRFSDTFLSCVRMYTQTYVAPVPTTYVAPTTTTYVQQVPTYVPPMTTTYVSPVTTTYVQPAPTYVQQPTQTTVYGPYGATTTTTYNPVCPCLWILFDSSFFSFRRLQWPTCNLLRRQQPTQRRQCIDFRCVLSNLYHIENVP